MRAATVVAFCAVLAPLVFGCGADDPFPTEDELGTLRVMYAPPATDPDTTNRFGGSAAARDLGAQLFQDPGVSACGTVSCQSCHPPPSYTVSTPGAHGCAGDTSRSPPTLLNVAGSKWFMWDGRKDSLWDQVSGPLLNPVEMGTTPQGLQQYLAANYASQYEAVFGIKPQDETDPDQVVANFGKALEAYERTLVKVDSPFDQEVARFVDAAENGHAEQDPMYIPLRTFVRRGRCAICHVGPMLSDGKFHDLGVSQGDAPPDHGRATGIDQLLTDPWNSAGEYSDDVAAGTTRLTGLSATRDGSDGAFRTAPLRNIAITAPYMHNGSLKTLDDVIDFYDRGGDQQGFVGARTSSIIPLYLSDSEKAALKTLLESLTGSENP